MSVKMTAALAGLKDVCTYVGANPNAVETALRERKINDCVGRLTTAIKARWGQLAADIREAERQAKDANLNRNNIRDECQVLANRIRERDHIITDLQTQNKHAVEAYEKLEKERDAERAFYELRIAEIASHRALLYKMAPKGLNDRFASGCFAISDDWSDLDVSKTSAEKLRKG